MQQLAISNSRYLYIDLRHSLINIDFILITNNNRDTFTIKSLIIFNLKRDIISTNIFDFEKY